MDAASKSLSKLGASGTAYRGLGLRPFSRGCVYYGGNRKGTRVTVTELSTILEAHYERLRRFVRARVSSPDEADDIVQEVCLRAVSRVETVRDAERVESWLFQIARHAIIDHYRRTRSAAPLPPDLIGVESIDEPPAPDLSRCLPSLLAGMAEPDREALRLTAVEGLKQRELAERLGISYSGAKSRVQRARLRLRELVEACCRPELDRLGGIINIHPSRECMAESGCGCATDCPTC